MSTKGTNQDALDASSSDSSMPDFMCSPPPELAGFKQFKYKLRWAFTENLPSWCLPRSRIFIKTGPRVRLQEALAMEFIARNTTIAVPRVLDVFSHKGSVYIVQERVYGPVLEDIWRGLSPEEQHSCIVQVKDCLDQLRALKPPHPERVQAVDGSGLVDSRVGNDVWGPFDSHREFHRFLRHDFLREQRKKFPEAQAALSRVAGKQYKSVFSHGDFGPHNMLWRDGRIAIIDWETAGWFPEYWDYVRAHAARGHFKDWWDAFEGVVDRYDDEAEAQLRISSCFAFYLR